MSKKTTDTPPADAPPVEAPEEVAPEAVQVVDDEPPETTDGVESAPDLEAQVAELQDRNLRLRAQLDNFRKRTQRDLQDARTFARIDTIETFLPVLDHFHMAMAAAGQSDDIEALREGMTLIMSEFERAFAAMGVERVPTVGEAFDPNWHEAIRTEPSTAVPEQHVVSEWKAGYRLGDRLLRAAVVVVSSGPPEDDAASA